MRPLAPAQRIRTWHTYLLVWNVHRILGLGVGVLILLMSASGGVLVMHHEVERILEPGRHVVEVPANADRLPIAPLVRAIAAAHAPADYRPFRLMIGRAPEESDKLMFVAPDGRTRWAAFVNPYTGEVLWHGADQSLFTPWLLALHMHLHAGGWGYIVTGIAGAGLFLLGLTGLYVYRDGWYGLIRGPVRFSRGSRLGWSSLHKWLGVVSIYFSLTLGLTGAIYSITIAPNQIAAPKPQPLPFDLTQLTAIEPALQTTRERFPGAEILRVSFPTTTRAALTVLALHREAPVWRKFSRIELDPVSGVVRVIRDAANATTSEKFSAMLAPLHFGFYGSPVVKWLYALGGFAPAILALSGGLIWYIRSRRNSSRPSLSTPDGRTSGQRQSVDEHVASSP
jgi:uncharacterized iron-regulated membrane protein